MQIRTRGQQKNTWGLGLGSRIQLIGSVSLVEHCIQVSGHSFWGQGFGGQHVVWRSAC